MEAFVYPQYGGKSLLNISSTILSLFGVKPLKPLLPRKYFEKALDAEKIILFVIDGLGDNLFQKEALKHKFFKNLTEKGFYSPITSVFPSTTAAAVNSLYSGLSPAEHGLPEWYVYFPELDCVLESLLFRPVDSADSEKILNPPKDILFNNKTIFEYLNENQVSTFSLISKVLEGTLYSESIYKGSKIVSYNDLQELTETLVKMVAQTKGKTFISVYYGAVDSAEHKFGHLSEEVQLEISKFSDALQNNLVRKLNSDLNSRVSLMLTADHGQLTVKLKDTIYLDEIEGLADCLKNPPTSGTRNAFLNIKKDKVDYVVKLLRKKLNGKAYVLEMEKAISSSLFGDLGGNKRFLERTGNVVLIALSGYTLGYHYTPDFELKLLGRHGGLSKDEMLIPFACARLDSLRSDP